MVRAGRVGRYGQCGAQDVGTWVMLHRPSRSNFYKTFHVTIRSHSQSAPGAKVTSKKGRSFKETTRNHLRKQKKNQKRPATRNISGTRKLFPLSMCLYFRQLLYKDIFCEDFRSFLRHHICSLYQSIHGTVFASRTTKTPRL